MKPGDRVVFVRAAAALPECVQPVGRMGVLLPYPGMGARFGAVLFDGTTAPVLMALQCLAVLR